MQSSARSGISLLTQQKANMPQLPNRPIVRDHDEAIAWFMGVLDFTPLAEE
jgi:hypothetical protein